MVVHADECFNSFNGFDQVTVKLYESEVRNHLKKKKSFKFKNYNGIHGLVKRFCLQNEFKN